MINANLPAAKRELAARVVASLYRDFDVERLENILAIGRTYEVSGEEEVLYLNEALASLIAERREASR
jgi:hypothetical protein